MGTYNKRPIKWDKERGCFRKFYRKRLYRFGKGLTTGPDDPNYEKAEMRALEEWHAIKASIDRGERQDAHYAQPTAKPAPVPPKKPVPRSTVDIKIPVKHLASMASPYAELQFEREALAVKSVEDTTIDDLVSAYLDHRANEARAETITARTYDQDRSRLHDFRDFCQVEQAFMASEIDSALLDHYRECQLKLLARDDQFSVSGETAKGRLSVTSRMIRWAYKREQLAELPRNLDNSFTRVKIKWPTVNPWTRDEVRDIFRAANRRLRCFVALALNGGFTAIDIATLDHGMLDWKAGIIDRRRNKTRTPQCVRLWKISQELIRAEMTRGKSGLVFLTATGLPLVHERVRDDGGVSATDSIRQMLNRTLQRIVRERLESENPELWEALPDTAAGSASTDQKLAAIETRKRERNRLLGRERRKDPRGFKTFRKCGADSIAEQFQDSPHLVDQYLAHGNRGMRDRYARHHFRMLHEATDWLCDHFDLDSI